jgi:hypothetical protein
MIAAATLQLTVNQTMAQSKCDALKIALEYIATRYPHFDPGGLKQVISERDNLWELTYELPADTLGGVPIVTIDTRTCTIVRAVHNSPVVADLKRSLGGINGLVITVITDMRSRAAVAPILK